MAQYALPVTSVARTSNTNTSQFTGAGDNDADWHDEFDEGFGAGRGDGTGPDNEVTAWRLGASGESLSFLESGLNAVTDPQTGAGHVMRMQAARTNNSASYALASSGQQTDGVLVLRDGGNVIASTTAVNMAGSWATYTYTLTGAEADAIVGYGGALTLMAYKVGVGGGAAKALGLSTVELEVPDAGGGAPALATRKALLGVGI